MEEFSGNAFSYWLLAIGTWLLTNSQQPTATNSQQPKTNNVSTKSFHEPNLY